MLRRVRRVIRVPIKLQSLVKSMVDSCAMTLPKVLSRTSCDRGWASATRVSLWPSFLSLHAFDGLSGGFSSSASLRRRNPSKLPGKSRIDLSTVDGEPARDVNNNIGLDAARKKPTLRCISCELAVRLHLPSSRLEQRG